MRRLWTCFMLAGVVLGLIGGAHGSIGMGTAWAQNKTALTLLNWSEYMDPELLADFEVRTGVHVREVYFESEAMRDEMLIESACRGYDLIVSSGPALLSHARRGLLADIDENALPNRKHIDPRWRNAHPQIDKLAVPFFWGTVGIGYRADKIKAVNSWRQLLEPEEALRNRIVMIKDPNDLHWSALKMLGHSLNSDHPAHYEQARRVLLAQKPFVKDYGNLLLSEASAMVSGDVWMAQMYNGDALVLQDHHPSIAYVVPREGTNLWVDYFAVLRHSPKRELAARFINFMIEPRNAAKHSACLMYATTNREAMKLLPKAIVENPLIYPPPELLERCEIARSLPPRIVRMRNITFNQLIN